MPNRAKLLLLTLIVVAASAACAPADQTATPAGALPTGIAQTGAKPSLTVSAPASGALVAQGSTVEVKSSAADTRGIIRVELWVDGVLYRVDVTREQEGLPNVSVTQTWPAMELGSHLLLLKAINRDGIASDTQTITISVVPSGAPSAAPAATRAPTGTLPPPATAPPPAGPPAAGCEPNAAFVADVSVPDGTVFRSGDVINKTWRVRNSGACAWEAGTQLTFVDGNQMGAPRSVSVPPTAPNATADLTVRMSAPATPGEHTGRWKLATAGGAIFGQALTILIRVASPATPTPTPGPTPAGVTISFIADRTNLPYGDCATLKWDVDNAVAVRLDGRGTVGHDTRLACPSATTEYVLQVTVADSGEPIERVLTLTVIPALRAAGATINSGDAVDLESAIKNQGDVDMLWDGTRIQPKTGATFAVIGVKAALTNVPQADCLNATNYAGTNLSGSQVAAGMVLCFKTSSGRNGKMRISDSSGTLAFQWIVW